MAELKKGTINWQQCHLATSYSFVTPPIVENLCLPPLPKKEIPKSTNNLVFAPVHQEFKDNEWVIVPNVGTKKTPALSSTHIGKYHKIQNDSLYGKGKQEGQEYMVAEVSLARITKKTIYTDIYGNAQSKFTCELKSSKWDSSRAIEVDEKDLYSVFQKAREKFHELIVFDYKGKEAIAEHIAEVYSDSQTDMITEYIFEKSGWTYDNGIPSYKIGTNEFYSKWNVPNMANLIPEARYDIFKKGFDFLKIGKNGKEIITIFAYIHMPYSLFWFRQDGFNIDFLLFINGWTGSLKTSTILECVDVFEPNISNRQTQITGSSWAAIRERLLLSQDSILLLDDYSKTQKTFSNTGDELIEQVVRSIGNGRLPNKKQVGGAKNQPVDVRALVIITGEDTPELGQSSFLRMLTVTVDTDTFDGNELRIFQNNRDIMALYVALYIEFLRTNANTIMKIISTARESYKLDMERITRERRLIENGVKLMTQVDIILAFGYWCGEDEIVLRNFEETSKAHIAQIIRDNDTSHQEIRMDALFIIAIMAQVEESSKYNLAEDASKYFENPAPYTIGFFDKDSGRIWLKFEDAMNAAKDYCKSHGKFLTDNQQAIKKALFEHGFLDRPKEGWVWRWTRGNSRGRFVKLFRDKVLSFVREMDKNV